MVSSETRCGSKTPSLNDDCALTVETVAARSIAAAEVACEEYFNPVVPEELAGRLRGLA